MTEWLTAKEAAQILNITDRHVLRLCEAGVLDCTRRGLMWFVSAESVEKEKQRRASTATKTDDDSATVVT